MAASCTNAEGPGQVLVGGGCQLWQPVVIRLGGDVLSVHKAYHMFCVGCGCQQGIQAASTWQWVVHNSVAGATVAEIGLRHLWRCGLAFSTAVSDSVSAHLSNSGIGS